MVVKVKSWQPKNASACGRVRCSSPTVSRARPRADARPCRAARFIAYETVTSPTGRLPLLAPMSGVAGTHVDPGGRLFSGEGAWWPRRVPRWRTRRRSRQGVSSGASSARMRPISRSVGAGLGSRPQCRRPEEFSAAIRAPLSTVFSSARRLRTPIADLVVGGVLIPGAAAPKLVTPSSVRRDEAQIGDRRCGD